MNRTSESMDPAIRVRIQLEDERFMRTAIVASRCSNDPVTAVGACIVDKNHNLVGIGYNCMPRGKDNDGTFSWAKNKDDPLNSKKLFVCHAELNAISNANRKDLTGCRIYVTLFPCNECAKLISQFGIEEVIYVSDKHKDKVETKASKKLLLNIGVPCRQYYTSG